MDFVDQVKQYAKRAESLKDGLQTEEATKTALIMPFFAMLGYDVFNPQEFTPEYTADVGIKKGEKVDYAIMKDGEPVILIECKAVTENLEKHDSQLFRYFGTSTAKFAILTNGICFRFYTDLDNPNKMDSAPFLSINVLNIRAPQVAELKRFCKSEFDIDSLFSSAAELKYMHEFKTTFAQQLENPTDDFVRLFLQGCYSGKKNQAALDRFRPILRQALKDYISETMNDKITAALASESTASAPEAKPAEAADAEPAPELEPNTPKIVTTEEELEAYFIVKQMLSDKVSFRDITYKDTVYYINILYKGNSRKWICRLKLSEAKKILIIPSKDGKEIGAAQYTLNDIYDILNYSAELHEVLERYT